MPTSFKIDLVMDQLKKDADLMENPLLLVDHLLGPNHYRRDVWKLQHMKNLNGPVVILRDIIVKWVLAEWNTATLQKLCVKLRIRKHADTAIADRILISHCGCRNELQIIPRMTKSESLEPEEITVEKLCTRIGFHPPSIVLKLLKLMYDSFKEASAAGEMKLMVAILKSMVERTNMLFGDGDGDQQFLGEIKSKLMSSRKGDQDGIYNLSQSQPMFEVESSPKKTDCKFGCKNCDDCTCSSIPGEDECHTSLKTKIDRHCALCLKTIPGNKVKQCSKCHRRAYCCRKCQTMDWRRKGEIGIRGQGHEHWCMYLCGEEDIDWEIAPVEGKGMGVFAKRCIPPLFRILVDGIGVKDIHAKVPNWDPIGRAGVFNHACNPNASRVVDSDFSTFVVYSKREILPGEEITISYVCYDEADYLNMILIRDHPKLFDDVIPGMTTFGDSRRILEAQWNIVCPPNCYCRDAHKQLLDAENKRIATYLIMSHMLKDFKYTKSLAMMSMSNMQKSLAILKSLNPTNIEIASLLATAFRVGVQMKKTMSVVKNTITKCYNIRSAIYHPESKICSSIKPFTKDPSLAPEYLALERK